MSDARWLDVEDDVAAAVVHLKNALALSRMANFADHGLEGYRDRMALMHSMQSAHTPAEAALLRVLALLDEEPPTGDDWHQKLIARLARPVEGAQARPALLGPELAADLQETRAFRHRAAHAYATFAFERAGPALAAAERMITSLPEAISSFKRVIDPPR